MKRLATIALLALGGVVALAQFLPNLSVNSNTNDKVRITWPYTNSGFALQESAALMHGANWQASALSPAFNSNSATFSVSAVATNAAKFFRLNQPADLRGIYIYSSDVFSISSNYSLTLSNSLLVPGVDGLVLVIAWSGLEPTNQSFCWKNFDFWMNQAVLLGKKVDVAVMAGSSIPAWVFAPQANGGAGVAPLNFTVSPHSGTTTNCIATTNAAPWDTNYLAAWSLMLSNLSNHLKSAGTYSNVTLLRLTGINRTTDELRLPAETVESTGLACVSNAPAIWQAAGYTPDKLLFAWSNILGSFQTNFPDKLFSVAVIPENPFPPIDSNTNIVSGSSTDEDAPLLALAGQELTGRLVVQFNFLMTGTNANPAVPLAAQSYGTLTAYQSNNYYGQEGGGAACGGDAAHPVPCTNDTYLTELQEGIYPLGETNSLRSQYIEVFPTNVISFSNAVWEVHQELFTAP